MIILQTSKGEIKLKLDHAKTPNTADNFLKHAKAGYYDNTIFHRVIDDFMIQGGGFEPGMIEKPGQATIDNEADKGGKNVRGSIAMARTPDPHSASTQFFINVANNPFLDFKSDSIDGWGYCVFGQVIDGMEVVDEIKQCQTGTRSGHQDVPLEDIVIIKVVVEDE